MRDDGRSRHQRLALPVERGWRNRIGRGLLRASKKSRKGSAGTPARRGVILLGFAEPTQAADRFLAALKRGHTARYRSVVEICAPLGRASLLRKDDGERGKDNGDCDQVNATASGHDFLSMQNRHRNNSLIEPNGGRGARFSTARRDTGMARREPNNLLILHKI